MRINFEVGLWARIKAHSMILNIFVIFLLLTLSMCDNTKNLEGFFEECEWPGKHPVKGIFKMDMTAKLQKMHYPRQIGVPAHHLELRTYRDTLTFEIQKKGYLEDCLTLYRVWRAGEEAAMFVSKTPAGKVFVDVGANIGACSILMASSGIETLAFEPMPSNLHYFTKSVIVNRREGPSMSGLRIFTAALGATSINKAILYTQPDNFGNSMLGTYVVDSDSKLPAPGSAAGDGTVGGGMPSRLNSTVRVVTFDEVIAPPVANTVPLMKIDVQGGEVSVLQGMKQTFEKKAETMPLFIFTEVDPVRLKSQGSSTQELFALLTKYGYEPNPLNVPGVSSVSSWDKLAADLDAASAVKGTNAAINILARLSKDTEPIVL